MEVLVYAGDGQGGPQILRSIIAVDVGETDNDEVQSVITLAAETAF